MFKVGDFVKVKPDTRLEETGELVNDWAGEVDCIFEEDKVCMVSMDAKTMDLLKDDYLKICIHDEVEPDVYPFEFHQLEKGTRRDTVSEWELSKDRLFARAEEIQKNIEKSQLEIQEKWVGEFVSSKYYQSLNKIQQECASFIADTFMKLMFYDIDAQPHEWDISGTRTACLIVAPSELTAPLKTFESYGYVLMEFFKFLDDKKYISNAKSLIKTVNLIKDEIAVEADNIENWGLNKLIVMSAIEAGVDMDNEEEFTAYMADHLAALEEEETRIISAKIDPFRKIGRNQKITIKYADGRIVEDIKFKKVEIDLRNGICEILNS